MEARILVRKPVSPSVRSRLPQPKRGGSSSCPTRLEMMYFMRCCGVISLHLTLPSLLLALPSVLFAATPIQYEEQKLLARDGDVGDGFGLSLSASEDTLVVGTFGRGFAYVFNRDGGGIWSEQVKLVANGGAADDRFGWSVSVSDDTAVVGAHGDDDGRGAAYVFMRDASGAWSEQAKLVASDGAEGDDFGFSVSISGDTVVVGAQRDADHGGRSGSAYVFTRDESGAWSEQAKLVASDAAAEGFFGGSVSLDRETVVVGASGGDSNGFRGGSAYVFTREASGDWTEKAKLVASDGAANEGFGISVSVGGDTIAVGTFGNSLDGSLLGSAYVFARDADGVWFQQAKLLANEGVADLFFFWSVSVSGNTVVVGAEGNSDNGDVGSAYVFSIDSGGLWAEQAKLLASDGTSNDTFGGAVSISGQTVFVGAWGDDENGTRSGSAYVFDFGTRSRAAFLSCLGDVNGSGTGDLVVLDPERQVALIKDVDGTLINHFALDGIGAPADIALMPDTNGNGAPELVVMTGSRVHVRDLLTGADLGTVAFDSDLLPVDLELVADWTGNDIPELAALGPDPTMVEIRDGLAGTLINEVGFAGNVTGKDLLIYPDLNGNGSPELGVLAENKDSSGSDKLEIRDSRTGALIKNIWLGRGWQVQQQVLLTDINGNGSPEAAVLRTPDSGRKVTVVLRDIGSKRWLGTRYFDPNYPPVKLLTLPDMDGNGADELVVFGQRFNSGNQKAQIRDSATGNFVSVVFFDKNFDGKDMTLCPDINGNGVDEIAVLGQRQRDGRYRAIIKDPKTRQRLGVIDF